MRKEVTMRLKELIYLIKNNFIVGVFGVLLLCLIFCFAYFLLYKKILKGKRSLTKMQLILGILLCGYLIMVLGLTLLDRGSYTMRSVNLHFLSSYRQAWNSFSLRNWQQIILNIIMFTPLGILLPICHKRFLNVFWTIGTGAIFTLFIELCQFATGFGVLELDDIFNNILGAFLGYCIIMTLLTIIKAKEHRLRKIAFYLSPVFITISAFTVIFFVYQQKEFGNLPAGYIYKQDMKSVNIKTEIELNNGKTEMNVYQAPVMSKEKSKEYAEKFYDNRKLDTSSMEIDAYQEEAVYWINRKYSLWVKYLDGTYRYTDFSEFDEGKEHMNCEEDKLKELLIGYGIHLPGQAVFEEVAAGKYQWKINKYTEGDLLTEGSLSCEYYNDNTIKSIDNNIVVYRKVKTTAIISQKEAYQQLADGKFQIWTNGNNLKTMVITAIELDYQLDTKGFYQPVYLFDTVVNGTETTITIPALRQ
jgi:glycopeptide antibiotics resistance protein